MEALQGGYISIGKLTEVMGMIAWEVYDEISDGPSINFPPTPRDMTLYA